MTWALTWAGLAALMAVAAALLAVRRPTTLRPESAEPMLATRVDPAHPLRRLRPVLVGLSFLAGWAFIGGVAGLVVGLAIAAFAWRTLGAVESPAEKRRRERLVAELPTAVDLLGSCLAAGAAPEAAVVTVAEAMDGPVADELWLIHHRLALGLDPQQVWSDVGRHPQLGALGRTVARTQETGSSISQAVACARPRSSVRMHAPRSRTVPGAWR